MVAKVENISVGLDMLIEDSSIPRNIRGAAEKAKALLADASEPLDVRKAKAISTLDEMSNDPNLPLHGRTLMWNIMSQLETLA
ncbi:MAG: UPF0147 family protein [Thermoplasmatota archaeon]